MHRFSSIARVGAVFGAFALAVAIHQSPTQASDVEASATYRVVFVPSWNPTNHPTDYPFSHAKQGLLTPVIGATHGKDFKLFAAGMKPTPGLERLSEMGKHDPLDAEIRKSIQSGKASTLIEFADASPGPVHPPVSHTFHIEASQSMVSLAGMIAPSPDWFYGVSAVELRAGGKWAASMTVDAFAWDSGGDTGTTYMSEDADTMAKQATRLLDNDVFTRNGHRVPVGVFIFTRVPSM